jgi:hypothetical protein
LHLRVKASYTHGLAVAVGFAVGPGLLVPVGLGSATGFAVGVLDGTSGTVEGAADGRA